jgi:hypothetical protein
MPQSIILHSSSSSDFIHTLTNGEFGAPHEAKKTCSTSGEREQMVSLPSASPSKPDR